MSYLGNNGNLSFGLAGSQFAGLRNLVINGNFDFWQRGSSLGSGAGDRYLADRFINQSIGTTYTASRQTFTLGQVDVPGEPTFFHRSVVTSVAGAGNFCVLVHKMEDIRLFSNKPYILSFWAKADANKNIAVEFVQDFGTGGAPSTFVTAGVFTVSLTTTFQKFVLPILFPSISGKTLGVNGDDNGQLVFWFDAGSSFNARSNSLGQQSGTFDLAQLQFEPGRVATPFEVRTRPVERILCQRYYEKSFATGTDPVQNAGVATGEHRFVGVGTGAAAVRSTIKYAVNKRSPGTVTLFNPAAANAQVRDLNLGADGSGTMAINQAESGFEVFGVGNAASTSNNVFGIHWTTDAEL